MVYMQTCASAGAAASYQVAQISATSVASFDPRLMVSIGAVLVIVVALKKVFDTPSRTYDPDNPNVGEEYDSWTQDGILEYYWGEHIHLGYYTEEERARGYKKKDFKQAKFDFVDEMLRWSGATSPSRVLDVGCGIGGTSRHLAAKFPDAKVQGITLSPAQVKRGTELAKERGLDNVQFQVMNALEMEFEDDTFDLVWACESGEHMPDKAKYVQEMTRVLKPGGHIVIATWCQREETPDRPFTPKDKAALQFLYDEWAHPYFVSVQEYGRLLEGTGKLESVAIDDWTPQTLPTWRHSNWVGVWDPWPVIFKFNPFVWYKVVREIVTLERMHRAFDSGLMEYGMAKAVKKASAPKAAVERPAFSSAA
ncbi:g10286 [Coccomyxa viridis]|uniref:G10286 protein n=1 Tax=Coccomyxa viridis TaxID=1274662 RepID=A0ABP1G562_9CHLO